MPARTNKGCRHFEQGKIPRKGGDTVKKKPVKNTKASKPYPFKGTSKPLTYGPRVNPSGKKNPPK